MPGLQLLQLKKIKLNTKTLEENLERFDHTVYTLKIITKSKICIKDQEDFKKLDNGHTLSIWFIEVIIKILK